MWFPTTVWTQVHDAAAGKGTAMFELVGAYRRPILRFIEAHLPPGADAEALADDVFLTVLRPNFLNQADRSKGRFRRLLLAVTRRTLQNAMRTAMRAKRTATRTAVSLDALIQDPPDPGDEERFRKEWTLALLSRALHRFAKECAERASPEYEAVRSFHLEQLSQQAIATRAGRSVTTVNNWLHRGRQRLRVHLLAVLREYCSSREEYAEEAEIFVKRLDLQERERVTGTRKQPR